MSTPHLVYTQLLVGKRLVQRASTDSMKGMVSKSAFSRIELICPPEDLRRDFAERFRSIERLRGRASLAETRSNALFRSLEHLAFSGRLPCGAPSSLRIAPERAASQPCRSLAF